MWDVMPDGLISIVFYANDTFGKLGFETISVYKDGTAPVITINTPSQNQIIGVDAPSYSISLVEIHPDIMWYTLDGGINNITFSDTSGLIDQSIWDGFGDGNVTIRFYAKDTVGNVGFQEVTVIKETPSAPPAIGGFEISILISIVCMVSLIWVKKRYIKDV
jgi:hypothetical protein